MNPLLETILGHGLLFDAVGVLGLGVLGLAAVKLARVHRSWGGMMMAGGAIALLISRLYLISAPHFMTDDVLGMIGPVGISLTIGLPPILLTLGLAGVVWGLWGHHRWLTHEEH
jgi:hypothetical protein